MPTFTKTGDHPRSLWLVDGDEAFAIFPGGIIPSVPIALPILLRVGNPAYGEQHILKRHGHWVEKQGLSVPELVYAKCGHTGQIYCTESESKLKVSLKLAPSALLILELLTQGKPHFSVTSLYAHPGRLDGSVLGRYPGRLLK